MRTTNYSDVLRGSAALAGIQVVDLSPEEIALFVTAHDRRLQVAWESHKWPDICTYEKRSFRAPWSSATTYAATNEVLDLPSLTYFQALRPSTNQPPTSPGAGSDGGFIVNAAYWAQSLMQYPADPYVSGTVYAVGSQVLNPADGLFYQLFQTEILVSGAGSAGDADGTFVPQATQISGRTSYSNGVHLLYWDGAANWVIGDIAGPAHSWYQAAADVATPDLVPAAAWAAVDQGMNPPPTVVATVPAPPNTACWGLLTPFQRYVGWNQAWATNAIGEFLAAWDFDPRITTKTKRLDYLLTADGAAFTTLRHVPAYVWLQIRLVRPMLTGATYSAAASYAATQQVYFTDALGNGNFFNCISAAAANQSPAANPTLWSQVQLPYIFRQYLIEGGYADWLTGDGQTDKATAVEGIAEQMLEFEADKLQRQQQQVSRLTWKS